MLDATDDSPVTPVEAGSSSSEASAFSIGPLAPEHAAVSASTPAASIEMGVLRRDMAKLDIRCEQPILPPLADRG